MRANDTPTEPHRRVAAEVRAELARQQISQSELAKRLGVAQQTVSRRITGDIPFDIAELSKIAEILGVPFANFLGERAA